MNWYFPTLILIASLQAIATGSFTTKKDWGSVVTFGLMFIISLVQLAGEVLEKAIK